jgi:hypothetical protein
MKGTALVRSSGVALLAGVLAFASQDRPTQPVPPAMHARTYPAHQCHDDQHVCVAVEPFDEPGKTAAFKINYRQQGFLPVRLIISNDGEKSAMLQEIKVEYVTLKREKLEPATSDDIYRRLSKSAQSNPGSKTGRKTVSPALKEALLEIDSLQFVPDAVPPHSTHSGFLFFDVTAVEPLSGGAHVALSGLRMNGKELLDFEIPLRDGVRRSAPK